MADGIVLDNRDEYRPRPTADGIEAEIPIGGEESALNRVSYDFWKLFQRWSLLHAAQPVRGRAATELNLLGHAHEPRD
jgi:hypothetical protein